jgi:hypothetical protein
MNETVGDEVETTCLGDVPVTCGVCKKEIKLGDHVIQIMHGTVTSLIETPGPSELIMEFQTPDHHVSHFDCFSKSVHFNWEKK